MVMYYAVHVGDIVRINADEYRLYERVLPRFNKSRIKPTTTVRTFKSFVEAAEYIEDRWKKFNTKLQFPIVETEVRQGRTLVAHVRMCTTRLFKIVPITGEEHTDLFYGLDEANQAALEHFSQSTDDKSIYRRISDNIAERLASDEILVSARLDLPWIKETVERILREEIQRAIADKKR